MITLLTLTFKIINMTKLTFFGGLNEVGGNKILIEDKKTKIFLDFGLSFGLSGKYFADFIQVYDGSELARHFVSLNYVVTVEGNIKPDSSEIAEVRWFNLEDAKNEDAVTESVRELLGVI